MAMKFFLDTILLLYIYGFEGYLSRYKIDEMVNNFRIAVNSSNLKQVDILISINQALQILYLKHITLHKFPWIETHENLISTKLNIYTVQFYYYITIVNKTYLIIGQQVLSKFFSSSICVI